MLLSDQARRARGPILAALEDVATRGGALALSGADRAALVAFDRYVLHHADPVDPDAVGRGDPQALARAVAAPGDREHVVQFLAVMALVDGAVDEARIA